MNLNKLFETQRKLDERIVKEKGLEGQDLLPKKILALQVELGELANEWRGFKFWSENQSPKPMSQVIHSSEHPMLMEYVDCLHFILSVGLEIYLQPSYAKSNTELDLTTTFIACNSYSSDILAAILEEDEGFKEEAYMDLITHFLGLGKMLGFTQKKIETAYYEKNKVNHERQESGY